MTDQAPPPPHDEEENEVLRAARELQAQKEAAEATEAADRDAAARAGITAIIQPGGSVRDEESIAAADEHGIAMIFTGMRHFKH